MDEKMTLTKEEYDMFVANYQLLTHILTDHAGILQPYADEYPELVEAAGFEAGWDYCKDDENEDEDDKP